MNQSVIEYCTESIKPEWIRNKKVLEIGSHNVNGSIQNQLKHYGPLEYIGMDMNPGPGVDIVLNADDIIEHFGEDAFDFVLSNECVEHVENWERVFSNIKRVLKPGGYAVITTRSKGFGYHAWPYDFWRYEQADMEHIFSDMEILDITPDPQFPGIFVIVQKPAAFRENNLESIKLFSIVKWKRLHSLKIEQVTRWDIQKNLLLYRVNDFRLYALVPSALKKLVKKILFGK